MSKKTKRGAFPLHMTPFESYMFVDDHPRYPMTFVVEFEFIGDLDRAVLQSSIDRALQRHPMLRTVIQPAKSSIDCWVLAEDSKCVVDWGDLDEPIYVEGAGAPINLRKECGVRCWVRHNHERAVLTTVFHHSATDGIGAYFFLGDALWFYAQHFNPDYGDLPDFDVMDLRNRLKGNIGLQLPIGEPRPAPEQKRAQPLSTFGNRPASSDSKHLFPQFQAYTFDQKEYRDLRLRAQDNGQNVNDLLLESLFSALGSWNELQGTDFGADDFCILMPLDLRGPENRVLSAANFVTTSFIGRSAEETKNRNQLSISLREEVAKIKHSRHNSEFMRMLTQLPRHGEVDNRSYEKDICHITAVFSNAGDPTKRFLVDLPRERGAVKCGNLVLDDLRGASPVRNFSRVAVNIFTYRRRLKICMRFDPQCFSDEEGNAFLDHFIGRFIEFSNG